MNLLAVTVVFLFLTGCGGIATLIESASKDLNSGAGVSLIPSTNQMIEGQQSKVTVMLMEPATAPIELTWKVLNADETLAPLEEFLANQGSVTIQVGESKAEFYVTSKPASLTEAEKEYLVEVSSSIIKNKISYPMKVAKNEATSAVSIATVSNQGYINSANRTAFELSGLCTSPTYNVIISVGSVSDTVVCSNTMTWETTLNLSALPEGAVTATISHAGESGPPASATRTLTKDSVLPNLTIASPDSSTPISSVNAGSFEVSGNCSENSRQVVVSAASNSGSATAKMNVVCNTGTYTANLNLEFIANGVVTISIKQDDVAGNSRTITEDYSKNATVPVFTVTSPTPNQVFNSANYNSLTIHGTCDKAGATINISGDLVASGTTTCNGSTWSVSGLSLQGADGDKTLSAQILDSSGNASAFSTVVKKHITLPTTTLIGAPTGTNNSTQLNVGILAIPAVNAKYRYKLGGTGSTVCSSATGYSGEIDATTPITNAIGADDTKILCVVGIDAYGNQQTFASATTATWTKKTTLPVVLLTSHATNDYVNLASQSTFAISGTCSEAGRAVTIAGSVAVQNVNCTVSNTWSASVDFSSKPDGIVGVFVTQTDLAGNTGQDAKYLNKKTNLPTVTIDTADTTWINRANRDAFTLSGTCSDYSDVDNMQITGADTDLNIKCLGSSGWTSSLKFESANNGGTTGIDAETRVLTVTITDVAGNSATVNKTFNIKTKNPTVTMVNPVTPGFINASAQSAVLVSGACSEPGQTVTIVASPNALPSSAVTKTFTCSASKTYTSSADNFNLTGLSEGYYTFRSSIVDAAGNTAQTERYPIKKTSFPVANWGAPLENVCIGELNKSAFNVSGTCEMDNDNPSTHQVTITSPQLTTPATFTCASGAFSGSVNLNTTGLADGTTIPLTLAQTDRAGNTINQLRNFKYLASGSIPTIVFGGWETIYATGVKTYVDSTPAEPGIVKLGWKPWPASNTCIPETVSVFRSLEKGKSLSDNASESLVAQQNIPSTTRELTDTSLAGATEATKASPTDFSKAWYYGLKVRINNTTYKVEAGQSGQELRIVAPPRNQALVHRWIANQKTCADLGKTSDKNANYRCNYNSWGKVADGGNNYFDLEKDLLVDRNNLGCKYTFNCGASQNQACVRGIFGTVVASIAAADGAVLYDNTDGQNTCFVRKAGAWESANLDADHRATTASIESHLPVLANISQGNARHYCQAVSNPLSINLAPLTPTKRLLRNKEWKIASMWPSTMTAAEIQSMEAGGLNKCNTNNANGLTTATHRLLPGTSLSPADKFILTGSVAASSGCQSQFGIRDMVGNAWEWTSDQLGSCSSGGLTCVGVTSSVDAGNTDLTGFMFDNTTHGVGGPDVTEFQLESTNTFAAAVTHFNIVLGLPMVTSDGESPTRADFITIPSKAYNDRFSLTLNTSNTSRAFASGGYYSSGNWAGRWALDTRFTPSGVHATIGARCATELPND